MYFDNVIKEINNYNITIEAACEVWNDTRKNLNDNYKIGSSAYEEQYAAGKAIFDAAIEGAKNKGFEIAKEAFAKAKDAVKEFIKKPVPNDFLPTLETIKALGKNITEGEAATYLETYKNNYAAYRSIAQTLEEQTGIKYPVALYDEIKEDIEIYSSYVYRIFGGKPGEYMLRLFSSEQHSPLIKLDEALTNFTTNSVAKYTSGETM
jgi:hypothetical protein